MSAVRTPTVNSPRARRSSIGVIAVGAVLVAGVFAGGPVAAQAAGQSGTQATTAPASKHQPVGGAVFSGMGGGDIQQTVSGLPSAGWGSFFTDTLSVFAGPQAAVPQPPAENVLPRSGWVGNLYVRNVTPAGQSPALAGPARFTVFDNDQATTVTCVIAAGASGCAYTGRAVHFAAGDLIAIQVTALSSQTVSLYRTSWSVTFS
jgi:hypothetical protein